MHVLQVSICDQAGTGRVLALVPLRCVTRGPNRAQSKPLWTAATACTMEMGVAAAGGANVMVGGGLASIVLVGEVVEFGPSGITFDPPATLRLPFCDGVIAKMRASGLEVSVGAFRWDKGIKVWRELEGAREDGGSVEVKSNSFSVYTVGLLVLGCIGVAAASQLRGGPPAAFSAIVPNVVRHDGQIDVTVFAYSLASQAQPAPVEDGKREEHYLYGKQLPISGTLSVELEHPGGSTEMPLVPKRTAPLIWNGEFRTNARLMVDCPRVSRSFVQLTAEIIFGKQHLGSIPFSVEVEVGAAAKRELSFHTMGETKPPCILALFANLGTALDTGQVVIPLTLIAASMTICFNNG